MSSTEVRRRLAAGEPVAGLVSPSVARMLTGHTDAAVRPSGGGWIPVGHSGGYFRRRSGRREYWYPGLKKSAERLLAASERFA